MTATMEIMEITLSKLLVSDSKTVQEGTSELKKAFLEPSSITTLCEVLVRSQRVDIRHITVVLLRRRFSKKRNWSRLTPEMRQLIKQGMLRALVDEQEKSVKTGIAQLLGQLGRFEIGDDKWPEFLIFIFSLCSSNNITEKELGLYTLSITTEMSHGTYINYFDCLASLFTSTFNDLEDFSSNIAYNTLKIMKNLVPTISGHQQMINVYNELLPRLMQVMKSLCYVDEHKAIEALGLLEELIDYAIAVVVPHIRNVVSMCLSIATGCSIPAVQVKAISVVGWLVKTKGKVLVKHQLITPIIDVLMELMALVHNLEEEEEYFAGDSDQLTPVTVATQTLDLIALNIPADKVVYHILEKIGPHIQGTDVNKKKAAFLCLAVLAEGCSECIRKKYMEAFINCVCEALRDNNNLVKNAAFFALGQFSEHLQPEVSQYCDRLMPLLLEFLDHVYNQLEHDKTESNCLDRLFYAISMFCENLGEGLLPYLPILMERIIQGLNPQGSSIELKKCCFSSLESVITAVKPGIMPYFPKIIEILKAYINSNEDEDNYELRSHAVGCLATVAEGIGQEHFKPLAHDSLQMGLKLVDTHDPDVRRSVFALFIALTPIMEQEIVASLPKIIQEMVVTLQSSDGIVTYYEDEDKINDCDVFGQSSESEENSDEEDIGSVDSEDMGKCSYSVENPYTEEKEQACMALKEICATTRIAFLPYLEKCFEEVFKLLDYPRDHIRQAAIVTITEFCVTLRVLNLSETNQALHKVLPLFVPKLSELIRSDEEKGVVMTALDAYASLLKEIKQEVFVADGHREAIFNCVVDVLSHKTFCQDNDTGVVDSFQNFEETTDAEQDEILLESACEIIPKFGAALEQDMFAQYFNSILQLLAIRTAKQQSVSQRSFAFGTLAECMKSLGTHVEPFISWLLKLWNAGMNDPEDEVRNNAVFGLGEMVLCSEDKLFNYYPDILKALSSLVSKENHNGVLDNICGAIAKIIIRNPKGIPIDQIFPVFMNNLPLRVDYEENDAVIKSLLVLFQEGANILKINIGQVTRITFHIAIKQQLPNDESKVNLVTLLRAIKDVFPIEFTSAVEELDQEQKQVLHQTIG